MANLYTVSYDTVAIYQRSVADEGKLYLSDLMKTSPPPALEAVHISLPDGKYLYLFDLRDSVIPTYARETTTGRISLQTSFGSQENLMMC